MSKREDARGKETKKPRNISQRVSSVFQSDFPDFCTYKLVYLFFYAAFGSTLVYLPLYFKYIGLNAAQVGVLTGLRPFIQVIGAPIGGFLADKFKRRKLITVIALLAFVLKHFGILLAHNPSNICLRSNNVSGLVLANSTANGTRVISDLEKLQNLPQSDFDGKETRRYEDFRVQMNTDARPVYHVARDRYELRAKGEDDEKREEEEEQKELRQEQDKKTQFQEMSRKRRHVTRSNDTNPSVSRILRNQSEINKEFITFLLIIVVCEFVGSCLLSLLDAAAVEYLGEERNEYGKFRLWGSLGICIASVTIGAVVQQTFYVFCDLELRDYRVLFYFLFGFSFLGLLAFMNSKHVYAEESLEMKTGSQTSKLKEIFFGIKNISFWLTIISLGVIDGFQMDFGPWFLDDLGTSSAMIGVATSLHFVVNAFTYMVSSYIINRLGYMNTLSVGLCLYAVVFIGFSFARSSWVAVVLYSLVGSVSSLTWSCGITYVAMIANPAGIVSTAEGFLNGIYTGFGIASGTIIGGLIIKVIDIRTAFRVDAALATIVVVILNVVLWADRRVKKKQEAAYQLLRESTDE